MTQPNITPPEKRKYTIKMNKKSFFPLLSLQITVSLHPKLQFYNH